MRRSSKRQPLMMGAILAAVAVCGSAMAGAPRKPPATRHAAAPARSIHVDATTVLCIADRGIQPTSKPVPKKGKRPAGLAVFGVGPLGLGVAEGDVLTEVLGQPVRSQAQVVAMVLAARNENMSIISAKLWHGMHPYSVTVEQPYDVPNCSADEPSCWRAGCANDDKKAAPPGEKPHGKR